MKLVDRVNDILYNRYKMTGKTVTVSEDNIELFEILYEIIMEDLKKGLENGSIDHC